MGRCWDCGRPLGHCVTPGGTPCSRFGSTLVCDASMAWFGDAARPGRFEAIGASRDSAPRCCASAEGTVTSRSACASSAPGTLQPGSHGRASAVSGSSSPRTRSTASAPTNSRLRSAGPCSSRIRERAAPSGSRGRARASAARLLPLEDQRRREDRVGQQDHHDDPGTADWRPRSPGRPHSAARSRSRPGSGQRVREEDAELPAGVPRRFSSMAGCSHGSPVLTRRIGAEQNVGRPCGQPGLLFPAHGGNCPWLSMPGSRTRLRRPWMSRARSRARSRRSGRSRGAGRRRRRTAGTARVGRLTGGARPTADRESPPSAPSDGASWPRAGASADVDRRRAGPRSGASTRRSSPAAERLLRPGGRAARRPRLRPRRRFAPSRRPPGVPALEPAGRAVPVGGVQDPRHPLLLDIRRPRHARGGVPRPARSAPTGASIAATLKRPRITLQRRRLPPDPRRAERVHADR